jgi:hypothetical protein
MAELASHTWCPVTSRDRTPRPLTIAAEVYMSKVITVKKAPKSTKSMTEAVKAIRVESGVKAGEYKPVTLSTKSATLRGG